MVPTSNWGVWTHPALALTHGLPGDIFTALFDWFFEHDVFKRWSQSGTDVQWQLHCVGGPGSGKTTLAALVARYLRDQFENPGFPVISVFVQKDVSTFETEFLEDFLHILYQDLGCWPVCVEDISSQAYKDYEEARFTNEEGSRVHRRISLIRKALYARVDTLKANSRAFLIFDGVDCCSPSLRILVEAELFELQSRQVSVFLTSRIAVFEQIEAKCEHINHRGLPSEDSLPAIYREPLDIYLQCKTCEDAICFPCFHAGRICGNCNTNIGMHESYDHVNIPIDIPSDAMTKFIAWDMEREHGDLGLDSMATKPPPSTLGLSFRRSQNTYSATDLAATVQELAEGHIGLAKARLDLIHEADSIEDILQRRSQLPANIVALFDTGIKAIETKPSFQRALGLKTMAAASHNERGLTIPEVQKQLHRSIAVETRSGEDLVQAAKGFVYATPSDNPQKLRCFHTTFRSYIVDRYSDSVHQANLELIRDSSKGKKLPYETPPFETSRVRFEPQSTSEEPAEITTRRLKKTVTTRETSRDGPLNNSIVRHGTRMWE